MAFRVLHTSDLHFGGSPDDYWDTGELDTLRLAALKRILGAARTYDAHSVLFAGNLFVRPPSDALQRLVIPTLLDAAQHTDLVLTHGTLDGPWFADSPELLACKRVHLCHDAQFSLQLKHGADTASFSGIKQPNAGSIVLDPTRSMTTPPPQAAYIAWGNSTTWESKTQDGALFLATGSPEPLGDFVSPNEDAFVGQAALVSLADQQATVSPIPIGFVRCVEAEVISLDELRCLVDDVDPNTLLRLKVSVDVSAEDFSLTESLLLALNRNALACQFSTTRLEVRSESVADHLAKRSSELELLGKKLIKSDDEDANSALRHLLRITAGHR